MRLASVVLVLAGLTVAACTDEDPPPPAAGTPGGPPETTDPGPAPELCAPLHRTLDEPNKDQYIFYPSDQAAVDALAEFLPLAGRPAPLPPGHPSQATAEKVLAEVFPAFKKVYPTETVGLDTPPRVAILEDPSANAFALSAISTDPKATKAPWVLVFHTGAFETAVNQDDLRGLLGHELGHLILRNRNDSVIKSYQRRYLAPKNESNTFGAYIPDDAKVGARIDELEKLRASVGRVGVTELGGLSLSLLDSVEGPAPQYSQLFQKAYAKYKPQSANAAACTQFEEDYSATAALFTGPIEPGDYAATVSASDRAKIKVASAKAKASLLLCVGGIKLSIAVVIGELFGVATPTDLDTYEAAAETKFAGKEDFFAELAELTEAKQKALDDLENATDLPLERLRFYRGEEDADVVSVRMMRQLGREPRAVGQFLLRAGGDEYGKACLATIQAGTVPPYGFVRDDHPAICWRYWNVDRLAKQLESCPK